MKLFSEPNRRPYALAAILLLIATVYVVTMPIEYLEGDEYDEFRGASSDFPAFSRSRHLLVRPLYRCLIQINHIYMIGGKPFIVIQVFNILVGLACVVLVHRILKLLEIPEGLSLAFAALVGLSMAHWMFSFCPDVGIHVQCLFLISVYLFVRYVKLRQKKKLHLVGMLAAGSACALFTTTMAIFVILMILMLLWDWKRHRDIHLCKLLAIVLLVGFVVGVVPFVAAAQAHGYHSWSDFWRFMSSVPRYTARLQHVLQDFGPKRFVRPIPGIARTFCNVLTGFTAVKLRMRGEPLAGVGPLDYALLAWALLFLLSLAVLSLKGLFSGINRIIAAFCAGAIILQYALGAYFLGSQPKGWAPMIPLFAILAASGSKSLVATPRRARVYYTAFIVVLLVVFCINLPPRNVPSIIAPDGWGDTFVKARQFAPEIQPGDLMLSSGGSWVGELWHIREPHMQKVNLLNFTWDYGLDKAGPGEAFLAEIDRIIEARLTSGHRVFINGITGPITAKQYGSWQMFESVRGVERNKFYKHLNDKFGVTPCPVPPGGRMFEIGRRAPQESP